ncbi:CorA family divalent cation transporter [Clostridium chromiireducens]|uniref:Magnesium transport protein CorA n=1 Tax=Clostridium chromiireducens TaxID=225345 RepID=A0A1V4IFM8_9CLOT|nr:CorA family divalent cation transporter [Clostridium chromiireducens]OPJ58465.1 magnesium transport protein CorA [Clostridium chromiireducens]
MIYTLKNDILVEESIDNISQNGERSFICKITFAQLSQYAEKLSINEKILFECLNGKTSKFESYEGFDYISIKIPNVKDVLKPSKKVCIFFTKSILVFIGDNFHIIDDIISRAKSGEVKFTSLSKILYYFFDKLTFEDTAWIEKIEYEIAELEEGLITSKKDNYLNKIIILRKKLLKLKRYYERLINIAESIEENDNGLIEKKIIKYFRMFTNRTNRLYQGVNNLRDYVTQVREAYQAQVDINQNNLMKLFTVVTTIFLPLTLIVGWYGMNFNMPEYSWSYSYPVVIFVSICIVVLCILWFKKNKWF